MSETTEDRQDRSAVKDGAVSDVSENRPGASANRPGTSENRRTDRAVRTGHGDADGHASHGGHGGKTGHGSHAEKPLRTTLRDPLLTRPRWSAVAWSAALGVLLLAAAAGLWWVSVRTFWGQTLDTIIWKNMYGLAPGWLRVMVPLIASRYTVDGFILLCALASVVIVAVRRRWVLLVQMAVFAALAFLVHLVKYALPRPVFDKHLPNPSNTSPSGHTMAIVTVAILLLMAAGLVWRAWAALFGVLAVCVGAAGLVLGRWHRPSDVAVAILLTGGLALLVFAFTRAGAMDRPGERRSSASIQIVSTILIVMGLAAGAYALYLLVQIRTGVWMSARWVIAPACRAGLAGILGLDGLVMGLVLACRQATASPLSALGLLGGPPKPVRTDQKTAGWRSGAHLPVRTDQETAGHRPAGYRPNHPQSHRRVAQAQSSPYKE